MKKSTRSAKLKASYEGKNPPRNVEVVAHRNGEQVTLDFLLAVRTMRGGDWQPNTDLQATLLLDGGEKVVLQPANPTPALATGWRAGFKESYAVSPAQLDLLAQSPVAAMRYKGAFLQFDATLDESSASTLPDALRCVTE